MNAPRGIKYRSDEQWAVSNMGRIHGTFRTRDRAIAYVEQQTGQKWSGRARTYMEIWKCRIVPR